MIKSVLWKIEFFIRNFSLKNALQCAAITFGVCGVIVGGTLAFSGRADVHSENGQGGFETPGMPVITEEIVRGPDSSMVPDSAEPVQDGAKAYQLSYISYRVRKGDMIGVIAENFDVTQDSIVSVNSIRSTRTIQIGQFLKIPTMPGILYTVNENGETPSSIAEKYKVDAGKIAAVNHVVLDASYSAGDSVFVPDAKLDWITMQEINGDLFIKPIKAKWYRSSRFGWRASPFTGKRSYHSGIDMACPTGTSIYAAMNGTVTATGYNTTYGNYVIISHHSGYKTLYGHMNAILCTKGQYVYQGTTKIGTVGSTGMSTGPHLHFTVFKNNKQIDPEKLWN